MSSFQWIEVERFHYALALALAPRYPQLKGCGSTIIYGDVLTLRCGNKRVTL